MKGWLSVNSGMGVKLCLKSPNEFLNWTETLPPPIIIDGEMEFEILEILDSKIVRYCISYCQ